MKAMRPECFERTDFIFQSIYDDKPPPFLKKNPSQ